MAGVPFNPMQSPKQPAEKPAPVTVDPAGLAKLRAMKAEAPSAGSMSDAQFALAMHQNYYSDVPLADYLPKLGLNRGDVLYELRAPGDPSATTFAKRSLHLVPGRLKKTPPLDRAGKSTSGARGILRASAGPTFRVEPSASATKSWQPAPLPSTP